jgi:tetratricopeptide (TPR) repeat protein
VISLSLLCALTALALDQPGVPHIRTAEAAYEAGKRAQLEKRWQPAAECFQKAIEIEPTFLEARESLIGVYLDSGQRLAAAAAITQLLEIEPGEQKYRLLLGQILLEQKQPERALAQFSLVLKREPYNADGLLGFAAAARQIGMKDRADAAMQRGRQHYPGDDRFKRSPGGVAQP